ncbi:MAG: hypothetical protein PHO32_05225 [Candidatus Cloacimonetes bacterium]|nr:hypothetical protein [Candidatus Cloacimonadota bacterium]
MGVFKDHAYCDFEGKYRIEVEARVSGLGGQYALIINNRKNDQISGIVGNFKLRGFLQPNEDDRLVLVSVKQGFFGTEYTLEIDGKEYPLIKDE